MIDPSSRKTLRNPAYVHLLSMTTTTTQQTSKKKVHSVHKRIFLDAFIAEVDAQKLNGNSSITVKMCNEIYCK